MKHDRIIAPTTFTYRTEDCGECNGGGEQFFVARVAGEYFDADLCSEPCPFCDGTGKQDSRCIECGQHEPLNDDGECQKCEDAHELPLAEFNEKYGLTVCFGDPLLKHGRVI